VNPIRITSSEIAADTDWLIAPMPAIVNANAKVRNFIVFSSKSDDYVNYANRGWTLNFLGIESNRGLFTS